MNSASKLLSAFAMAAGALGGIAFFALIGEAQSAPQEASISAMILAPVICVYVFVRGADMLAHLPSNSNSDSDS